MTKQIKNIIIGLSLIAIGFGLFIYLRTSGGEQLEKYPPGSTVYEVVEGEVEKKEERPFEEIVIDTIIKPGERFSGHGIDFGVCTNGGNVTAKVRTNGYSTTTLAILNANCN